MTIKIEDKEYQFPASFMELTIDEYLTIREAFGLPIAQRMAKITGIPAETLGRLTVESIASIAGAIAFIEKDSLLDALTETYTGQNIGLCSYGKIEQAKLLIKDNYSAGIVKVAELYTGQTVQGRPLIEVWGMVKFYTAQLNEFFARFKELGNYEYSEMELEAGVEGLAVFGFMATVFKIGRERGMTNDQVLDMPAVEVYTEMLYDFKAAEYQKAMQSIAAHRQKHFEKMK